jgi:hypothetical protein
MAGTPSDLPSNAPLGSGTKPAEFGRIIVAAGELDRDHSIVSFPLAPEVTGSLLLRAGDGSALPLQLHPNGTATFILESLAKGARAAFTIERTEAPTPAGAEVHERGRGLELVLGDRTVVRFQMQGELPRGVDDVFLRGGYLHPLYTPEGVPVTGDYPEDHYHHHGIWSAWTRTRFEDHAIDFWNLADRQGKVDFRRLEQTWQGPVFAGFTATLEHVDLLGDVPVVALNERWTVTTYQTHARKPPYFVVDLVSTQETATEAPLLLEEYTYGGFALRGHAQWSDPSNVAFTTSEGLGRIEGNDAKGRWCALGGQVFGSSVGVAMLGHPENFRAPQTLRIHPEHPSLAFAPVKDGPFTIEPGSPYLSRFRIVSFDGPVERELVERLWRDYATPARVTVD